MCVWVDEIYGWARSPRSYLIRRVLFHPSRHPYYPRLCSLPPPQLCSALQVAPNSACIYILRNFDCFIIPFVAVLSPHRHPLSNPFSLPTRTVDPIFLISSGPAFSGCRQSSPSHLLDIEPESSILSSTWVENITIESTLPYVIHEYNPRAVRAVSPSLSDELDVGHIPGLRREVKWMNLLDAFSALVQVHM